MKLSARELELKAWRDAEAERQEKLLTLSRNTVTPSRNAPVSRKAQDPGSDHHSHAGRRPMGDRAMTPAERQRRKRQAERALKIAGSLETKDQGAA